MTRRTNPKMPTPRDVAIFERATIRGERQTALASEFGLSKQRVGKICERVGKLVFQELLHDVRDDRRVTLMRLEHLYAEALAGWERSKAGTKSETTTVGQAESAVVSITRSETFGNPRFLAEARSALAGIRELCGWNAPQKVEVRSTDDVDLDIA